MSADRMDGEKSEQQNTGWKRQWQNFLYCDQRRNAGKDQQVFEPPCCSINRCNGEHAPNHEENTRHQSDREVTSQGHVSRLFDRVDHIGTHFLARFGSHRPAIVDAVSKLQRVQGFRQRNTVADVEATREILAEDQ